RQGYLISDFDSQSAISVSYGYRLPRRGNTIDQANNEGFSRLDDGDMTSFWKSNPYLDRQFTGESNSLHPQWIVIEFEKPVPINAIRVLWGVPFARRFKVQYGNFDDVSDIALNVPGTWQDFPRTVFAGSADAPSAGSGAVVVKLANAPIKARWLRILLTESSETNSAATSDIRDRLGFAMRELCAGTIDARGEFHPQVRNGTDRRGQMSVHCASTDPLRL